MNSNALNIERATGLKTPANVLNVRPVSLSVSEMPNSTYPSVPELELVELFPTNAPNLRNIRIPAMGDLSFSAWMTFGLTISVEFDVGNILAHIHLTRVCTKITLKLK